MFLFAVLAPSAAYAFDTSNYRGQLRAKRRRAVRAADSVFASLSASASFHTRAACRAKPAFLVGGGTCTVPSVADLVLLDAGMVIVDVSGPSVCMAFQASGPTLHIAMWL